LEYLIEYGYYGLFVASFLAATLIPISSEALLSMMVLSKAFDFQVCIIVATFGNWLGGMSSYFIGYLGRWDLAEKYLGISETKILKWKNRIDRYSWIYASLCWLPIVGDVIAVTLGFLNCNKYKVAVFMFLGKFVRYLFWAFFIMKLF